MDVMQIFIRKLDETYEKNIRFHSFNIKAIGASLRRALRADCLLKKMGYNVCNVKFCPKFCQRGQLHSLHSLFPSR